MPNPEINYYSIRTILATLAKSLPLSSIRTVASLTILTIQHPHHPHHPHHPASSPHQPSSPVFPYFSYFSYFSYLPPFPASLRDILLSRSRAELDPPPHLRGLAEEALHLTTFRSTWAGTGVRLELLQRMPCRMGPPGAD
jgi:hypothetical protein